MESFVFKGPDVAVKLYLEERGFEVLFPQGIRFSDEHGKLYDPETPGLMSIESEIKKDFGTERIWARTEMDTPRPEEDVYQLIHHDDYWGPPEINFVNVSPRPGYYKAAVLSEPIACWRDHILGAKTLYSVLMLKTYVDRQKELVRDSK